MKRIYLYRSLKTYPTSDTNCHGWTNGQVNQCHLNETRNKNKIILYKKNKKKIYNLQYKFRKMYN